ncbi:hypothetical protein COLO4_24623 [Corchorus olitorius]|uniref:Uncharacterized protein n=1 Tax=Corchorus olitorius TaxID=93759 RepID=A0A1R3I8P9_9ROSI|nr:hypothetical protein COLO4_24623 [Corchorus olitorius]
MPDLIRHPASPSPWAERTLFAARTRVGWIPAQGRDDGSGCHETPAITSLTPAASRPCGPPVLPGPADARER